MDEAPTGQLFSQVYLPRGTPGRDSVRMRKRIATFIGQHEPGSLGAILQGELGVDVPAAAWGYDWPAFFERAELRDVLDTVTLFYRLQAGRLMKSGADWLQFVERVFREENAAYTVDERGGVHFYVDQAFEGNRRAAVAALSAGRFRASREALIRGFEALDGASPHPTSAVRGVFDSAEILFKLMFAKASRLGASEINNLLKPAVATLYGAGNTTNASKLLCTSFAEWVNAAHHYRHQPGTEEPEPPPTELAVALVSAGAGHVRWLAQLDAAMPLTPLP